MTLIIKQPKDDYRSDHKYEDVLIKVLKLMPQRIRDSAQISMRFFGNSFNVNMKTLTEYIQSSEMLLDKVELTANNLPNDC